MEEDNLDMGMFGNLELNGDFNFDYDDEPIEKNEDGLNDEPKDINDRVEDEDPEGVDNGQDDLDDGSDEDGKSSSNLYSSLAAVVHEQGLLPSLDIENNKIETVDDFVNAFKKEQEIQAQAKLEEYLNNIDVSKISVSKKIIQDLNEITQESLSEDISLAKKIIYDDYINQGLDEKKATRLLNRLVDLGEDAILEDAAESLSSLKEFESRKIEKEKESYKERLESERRDQEELDRKLKETIYDKKDLVNGLKVNKALQDKVFKSITEIVGKSPDGNFENKFMKDRRESPIEFETRMYYFYELTNGFKDYSKLILPAKSNAVKDLENIARKSKTQDNGTPLWMQDNNSYDNVGSILNI